MNAKKTAFFKKLLQEQRSVLILEAQRTVSGMTDSKENFPDPTDRATLESDRNFLLKIRGRERKLILKIEEALERIEDKSFGICEKCGEDISEQRLKARPVTTHCIDCKKKEETPKKCGRAVISSSWHRLEAEK